MSHWPLRRSAAALATSAATVLVVGIPTVLIPTPWFGREVPPTPWAWPVLLATSILSGLLTATYVNRPGTAIPREDQGSSGTGMTGGLLAYFAVGCPVCNKIALLALGASGAIRWFAPAQPFLAVAGIGLLAYALRRRLNGERACPLPQP